MRHAWQLSRHASPAEFEALLDQLRVSQEGCGRYLGVSGRTVRRYVSGDTMIPPAHVLLLRALVACRVPPIVPKRNRGKS